MIKYLVAVDGTSIVTRNCLQCTKRFKQGESVIRSDGPQGSRHFYHSECLRDVLEDLPDPRENVVTMLKELAHA